MDVVDGQAVGLITNPRHNGCEVTVIVYVHSNNYGPWCFAVVGEGHVQVSGTQQLKQDNNKYMCGGKRLLRLYALSSGT